MSSNVLRLSILAAGAVAASAQSARVITANIPFEFNALGASMPAGAYRVDLNNPNMLVLRAADGRVNTVMTRQAESANPPDQAKLVFHSVGGAYFLSEVWSLGTFGRHIPPTRQERNLAQHAPPSDRVIVAAR